ncbi:ABC transporter substrate-binding protein [Sphingomonas sp. So64.6b]|uniref:ABC transporter substrate-binding protein n=1 Tax=Sphingomonas sp. So64.6b TaxID=2997354 RepID=UPI0015FF82D8|nr:ABC transporter substrate-binding protein [Sphingomonas sp. So64.6b]QNA82899.1 ABC transporter substrate-binding protein [Sphingomonas sp. So64.6b]
MTILLRRSIGALPALITAALLLAGCDRRSDAGPVIVSAIGGKPQLADPSRGARDLPGRLLLDSTAQGLVRFDASGQIEPGIAERWIVIDDGMSYIFRLRDAEWSDGRPVTAEDVVTVLRRQIQRGSRNPLLPFLTAIDEIVEMTPEVIEVRLKRPRPDLLKLFAQPELAVFRTRPPGGSGPFRITNAGKRDVTLHPAFDPARSPDEVVAEPGPAANVQLIGERAARAILRFAARDSDLVSGGTFVDWPLLAHADIAPVNRRLDPAAGLFGLVVANREGFLGDTRNRLAVAAAIDRDAIVAAFSSDWTSATQLLPEQLDSARPAMAPDWAALSIADRYALARARVDEWRADKTDPPRLRIAMPTGPGATILYGMIGASLHRVGIDTVRVALDADTDLRLIDAVAPYDSARWYLGTACSPCGEATLAAIEAARDAPSTALRARHLAEADAALAADGAFIPIARPLRWSLVALRLRQWQGNSRAWHPLNHLRNDTN